MHRRRFLAGTAGLIVAGAAPSDGGWVRNAAAAGRHALYLVPGYRPDQAHYRGRPLSDSPEFRKRFPPGFDDTGTMVTRIDEADGSVRRALMPIKGHAIAVRPGGGLAVWNSIHGDTLLGFDPTSLELVAVSGFAREGFVGGGHAAFTADGRQVLVTERRRRDRYSGNPIDHYGQVSIRDAETLRVIEVFSAHGMSPHDIALLPDGKHVAVANYGSFVAPDGWRPHIVEPCMSIIELGTGRLVEKLTPPDATAELRHLAAGARDRLSALLVRRGSLEEEEELLAERAEVYEVDSSSFDEGAYLPGAVVHFDATFGPWQAGTTMPRDPLLARHGQSLVYDPRADEMIVTFTSSHTIGVFAGEDGRVKRIIHTDRLGLRYPRGISLHPDGIHYAVSGSWRDLHLFRRGTHEIDRDRSIYAVLFDHSHLSIG